jgi:hypothetical protein
VKSWQDSNRISTADLRAREALPVRYLPLLASPAAPEVHWACYNFSRRRYSQGQSCRRWTFQFQLIAIHSDIDLHSRCLDVMIRWRYYGRYYLCLATPAARFSQTSVSVHLNGFPKKGPKHVHNIPRRANDSCHNPIGSRQRLSLSEQ